MKAFNSIRVAVKLPIIMVTLSLMALVVTTGISYLHARASLTYAAESQLLSLVDARASALERYADNVAQMVGQHARSPLMQEALQDFTRGYAGLAEDPEAHLVDWYQRRNPFGPGAYQQMDAAADGSAYSRTHAKFHPYFQVIADGQQVEDLYLVSAAGQVVYSVQKDAYFARSLNTLPGSALARLADQIPDLAQPGAVVFSDFIKDSALGAEPVAFLASPVRTDRGLGLGYVVVRLATAPFAADLNAADAPDAGYLVGPDGLLRSDFAANAGPGARALEQAAMPEAMQARATADHGVLQGMSFARAPVFVAYAAADVFGQDWSVFLERDYAAQFASADKLLFDVITNIVVLLALICGMGVWLARSVSVPLVAVGRDIRRVAARDFDVDISGVARGDEIGTIAKSLAELRDDLRDAQATQAENDFKSAAFQGSSAAMLIMDGARIIRYVNPAAIALMQRHREAFAQEIATFDPTGLVGQPMDLFHKPGSMAGQKMQDPRNFPLKADIRVGEARFSLMVNMATGEDGAPIGFVVEWQDVTAERMQKALVSAINTHQCVAEFDLDGRLVAHNDQFRDLVGAGHAALGQTRLKDLLLTQSAKDEAARAILSVVRQGASHFGRFHFGGEKATGIWLEGSFSPVLDRRNAPLKVLFLAADVTQAQRKLDAAEFERARLAAEQSAVVETLRHGLERLSAGDLTASLDEAFASDYEQLRLDFNAAIARLNEAFVGVVENATAIRGEAREISNAADDLSQRTEKQAGTLEETAAALDELTASVQSAAEGAAQANVVVAEARSNAVDSGSIVKEAVSAMGLIDSSSSQISKIIGVIDDIAFQTNLLALNAGVEAARAGDAGRGFAVVASEVRALAQRSSEAAKEISELISTSRGHVTHGVELVDRAGQVLERIVGSVGNIADHVSEIAASAQQQSVGLAEINASVNQLDQVTQQNAAMFQETTAASHALTREAQNLMDMIGRFKTALVPPPVAQPVATPFASRPAAPARPAALAEGKGPRSLRPTRQDSHLVAVENDWHEF